MNEVRQALALHRKGRLAKAETIYRAVLQRDPSHTQALYLIGTLSAQKADYPSALEFFQRVLAVQPDHAEAYSNRGIALQRLNRLDEALASYDLAIAIQPRQAETHNNRGNTLQQLKRLDDALASYDQAIAIKPGYAKAHNNRGSALWELNRFEDALESYNKAIALNPSYAEAYSNRGNALHKLRRFEEALDSHNHALSLQPDHAEAYCNRGSTLQEMKRLDEALVSFQKAIAIKPDYPEAYWNLALAYLLSGAFGPGWSFYEWRWRRKANPPKRHTDVPLWLGNDVIAGKTLLLWSEQGFGDSLQFCRYVQHVSKLGAKIVLEVPQPLVTLLSQLPEVSELVPKGGPLPPLDFQCPLLSLPYALNIKLQDLSGRPYLHAPEPKAWIQDIPRRHTHRVGLVWSGSSTHQNDMSRSIALKDFLTCIPAFADLELIGVQKDIRASDQRLYAVLCGT